MAARSFPCYMTATMVRRIPKPFTVEIRKSSRKSVSAAALTSDPIVTSGLSDQPSVSWPGLDEPSGPDMATEVEAVAPTPTPGRILPALDEPATTPEAPARQPTKREPTEAEAQTLEGLPMEAGPADLSDTAVDQEDAQPVTLADTEPPGGVADGSDAKTMAATLILRQGRKRLTRDDFKRGERWKARLPAVVHRRRSRPAS